MCWVYRERLQQLTTDPLKRRNRHLLFLLLLGFLPAAIIGFLAHGFIKSVLFNPWVVSVALIVGGVAIIVIERVLTSNRFESLDTVPRKVGLQVGVCQARATIMGGRVLGLSRGVAAEFSFLLAIPTMFAASGYDLYKNVAQIDNQGIILVLIGFSCALIAAVLTVRWLIGFVSSHTFSGFGWYRIGLGTLMLALLAFGRGEVTRKVHLGAKAGMAAPIFGQRVSAEK